MSNNDLVGPHLCPACNHPTTVKSTDTRGFWTAIQFECPHCFEHGLDFENAIAPNKDVQPVFSVPVASSPAPALATVRARKARATPKKPKKRTPAKQVARHAPTLAPSVSYNQAKRDYDRACAEHLRACKLQRQEESGRECRKLAAAKVAAAWAKLEAMKLVEVVA